MNHEELEHADGEQPEVWAVLEEAAAYGAGEPVPLKDRTKDFALRVIRMYSSLPS